MTSSEADTISLDRISEIIAGNDYEIAAVDTDAGVLTVRDLDTGVLMTCALKEQVLLCTVPLLTTTKDAISPALMWKMLDSQNGISTSSFQFYENGSDVRITLNNFAKLQSLGSDDQDDILSCLEFLIVDAWAARPLLAELG